MNEDRMTADREAMNRRVAAFQETQARFQRERNDFYDATLEKVRTINSHGLASRTADQ